MRTDRLANNALISLTSCEQRMSCRYMCLQQCAGGYREAPAYHATHKTSLAEQRVSAHRSLIISFEDGLHPRIMRCHTRAASILSETVASGTHAFNSIFD